MAELDSPTLSHFTLLRYQESYYLTSPSERRTFQEQLWGQLQETAQSVQIYQVYPSQADVDLLIWSSTVIQDASDTARFFECFARASLPFRGMLQAVNTLWGFTRPSQYTKVRSAQEIDPFAAERKPYLVLYPFVKTTDWYLLSQEARQGMMNGHIRIGKQYPEIQQLLLYSFGLQDQEFIVVYETADLAHFSNLVYTLRDTDARRYTLRDTPLYTALYHPARETLALWE